MKRLFGPAVALFVVLGVLISSSATTAAAPPGGRDAAVSGDTALVQLAGDPLSVNAATRPGPGRRVDLGGERARSERARLVAVRNEYRRWLQRNAPAARITREYDLSVHAVAVELRGTSLEALRAGPGVLDVELQQVFTPLAHEDPDLALVRAELAWAAAGGPGAAGAGVRVAVIDSGIDVTHPCFDDEGYPTQARLGDLALTNDKVVVARAFSNRLRQDGLDASAVDSHGTHVAGTVACNLHTPAVVDGVDIPFDPSGVAPRALLGNYNVFPGESGSARSEDILDALDAAYADGMDVANMSLGGSRGSGGILLGKAIDNLDRANMVIAVAAGNEGPDPFTVGYPGAAARALTAGASTVGHSVVNEVVVAGLRYEAVVGEFGVLAADLTAPLAVVADPDSELAHGLDLACDGGPRLPDLDGTIALLGRGVCDFTDKMRNAQVAGAVGVIMVNRVPGEAPFVMGHVGPEEAATIPGYMVSLEDGLAMSGEDGEPATLTAVGTYAEEPSDTNLMASFSSQGPTLGDLLVKPDVVAPGADVISAFPATSCDPLPAEGCWSFLGGTSMATPHVAGAAAVVRGAHPTWTAAQVRSAVVNTAQEGVLRDSVTGQPTTAGPVVGAGLLDVDGAVRAVAALDPVSRSFGAIATQRSGSWTATTTVTNLTSTRASYVVTVTDDAPDGVTFTADGGTFTLAPGDTRSFGVTATAARGLSEGPRQATLRVASGAGSTHAVLYALVGSGTGAPGRHSVPPGQS